MIDPEQIAALKSALEAKEKDFGAFHKMYETVRDYCHAAEAESATLRARLEAVTADRDEWKEATISANTRFKQAEATLAELKTHAAEANHQVWERCREAEAKLAAAEKVLAKFHNGRCPSCGYPEEPGDEFEGWVGMKARAEKAEAALTAANLRAFEMKKSAVMAQMAVRVLCDEFKDSPKWREGLHDKIRLAQDEGIAALQPTPEEAGEKPWTCGGCGKKLAEVGLAHCALCEPAPKPEPKPEQGYWWCPECREEVHATCVTKFHEDCGRGVVWKEPLPKPEPKPKCRTCSAEWGYCACEGEALVRGWPNLDLSENPKMKKPKPEMSAEERQAMDWCDLSIRQYDEKYPGSERTVYQHLDALAALLRRLHNLNEGK